MLSVYDYLFILFFLYRGIVIIVDTSCFNIILVILFMLLFPIPIYISTLQKCIKVSYQFLRNQRQFFDVSDNLYLINNNEAINFLSSFEVIM